MFATLVFFHFAVDWFFQTHHEAMNKHKDWQIRARHCVTYATLFLPYLIYLGWDAGRLVAGWSLLFLSHFVEDTYIPVYLWARFVRRVPEVVIDGFDGFKRWVDTTLGKILMIGIDQIIHICFLWGLVWMA